MDLDDKFLHVAWIVLRYRHLVMEILDSHSQPLHFKQDLDENTKSGMRNHGCKLPTVSLLRRY